MDQSRLRTYARTYQSVKNIREDVKGDMRNIRKRIPSDRLRHWWAGSFIPPQITTYSKFRRSSIEVTTFLRLFLCGGGGNGGRRGWRRGSLGRSSDAYSAWKRGKVRTTTKMVSSSPRGGGGPRDETEMFAYTFCPSFHIFILEGNIVEEISFIFRFFLVFMTCS